MITFEENFLDQRKLLKLRTFMKMCKELVVLSHDPKYQVAAMIITDDFREICAIGYNGNYSGGPHLRDGIETGKSGFLHAECNACIKLGKPFELRSSLILLSTHTPCPNCAKLIVNAGITKVIYDAPYFDAGEDTLEIFKNANVSMFRLL